MYIYIYIFIKECEQRKKELDVKEREKARFMKENEAIGEKLKKMNDFLRSNKQIAAKAKPFDPRAQPLSPRCRPEDRGSPVPVPRTPRDLPEANKIQPNFMMKDYKPYKYEEIVDLERKKSPISVPQPAPTPRNKTSKKNVKERLKILLHNQEEEKRQERLLQGKELESKANELREQKSKERDENRRLMFEQIREQQRKMKKLGKKGNKVEVEFVGINVNNEINNGGEIVSAMMEDEGIDYNSERD